MSYRLKRSLFIAVVLALLIPMGMVNAQDVTTVVWWTEQNDSVDEFLIPLLQDAFNAEHDNIQLEIIGQESLNDVNRTALQAGAAPDILQTPGASFIAEFVAAGQILPLSSLADQYGWKDKLLPWAYNSGILQGELYSIPITYESLVLFYNKTLFDEMGWEPPTTQAEIDAIAAEAIANDIFPFTYGNASWQPSNEHLMGIYLNNYAGPENVYLALTGQKSWTDREFAEATDLLATQLLDGWFSGDISNYYANTGDDIRIELASGEAAMMQSGTWNFRTMNEFFEEQGTEWDWVPLPPFHEQAGEYNYELATGSTISVNANTENPEAVGAVIDYWLSSPARVLAIAAGAGYGEFVVPIHFTVDDFPVGTDERIARFFADFAEVTAQGRAGYTTWTFWPADANVHLWTDIERVWAGEISTEEYLEEHEALWEQAREEGKTLAIPDR